MTSPLHELILACVPIQHAPTHLTPNPQTGRGPDWRFVDVLPERAGKGAAMEWVRARLGFDPDHTVACGDGPNDMLMLQQVGGAWSRVAVWYHACCDPGVACCVAMCHARVCIDATSSNNIHPHHHKTMDCYACVLVSGL